MSESGESKELSFNEQQIAFAVQQQQETPKAPLGLFQLPCGLLAPDGTLITEIQLHEITGVEEQILAAKNIPGAQKFTQIITNCTDHLGPVTAKPLLQQAIRNLPLGDRIFLFIAIRRVSLGDDFPFEERCPNPQCRTKSIFTVNLSELTIQKMPNPKQRIYDHILPSGKNVRWHVMTGAEEEELSKYKDEERLNQSIIARLDLFDGQPADVETVQKLGIRDRNFLRDAFNEFEGGVDTTLELICPACSEPFASELNPGALGFFFPTRVLKNSKISTSSSSKLGRATPT